MSLRFQADADLNHIIVKAMLRREPSIDFQTAQVARLAGVSDPEVLALAARAGRVLVTHDRKTMPKHLAEFIVHTPSSGVIVMPQKLRGRRRRERHARSERLHGRQDADLRVMSSMQTR